MFKWIYVLSGFFAMASSISAVIAYGVWLFCKSNDVIPGGMTVEGGFGVFVLWSTGPASTMSGFVTLIEDQIKKGMWSIGDSGKQEQFVLGMKYGALDQLARVAGAGLLLLLYNNEMVTDWKAVLMCVFGLCYVAPVAVLAAVYTRDNRNTHRRR